MRIENRTACRVEFRDGYPARIVAVDGSWQRRCLIADISENGARLEVKGEFDQLQLGEFFLALSIVGTAHRRCCMVWLQGDQVGVSFVRGVKRDTKRSQRRHHAVNSQAVEP